MTESKPVTFEELDQAGKELTLLIALSERLETRYFQNYLLMAKREINRLKHDFPLDQGAQSAKL